MISIHGVVQKDIDQVLEYFEFSVKKVTDMFLKDSAEKDDCRQLLRIKIWRMFENRERTFNTSYVVKRLKCDTINFINRDAGYKWWQFFSEMTEEVENEATTREEDPIDGVVLASILEKHRDKLTNKQYEAVCLFLSGMTRTMVSDYFQTKNKNLTTYYLLLSSAVEVLKRAVEEDNGNTVWG